jgi:hypothetical protein
MSESKTLYKRLSDVEQRNLMAVLKDSDAYQVPTDCRAVGPNGSFPLPWVIERVSGTPAYSIISVGGSYRNTVVSMTDKETAERIIEEVNE